MPEDILDASIRFLDTVCKTAESIGRDFADPEDDWAPVMMTATPRGESFDAYTFGFDGNLLASDQTKDVLVDHMMVPLIQGTGAKLVATVFSTWMLKAMPIEDLVDGEYVGPRPSQSPNRIEAVVVTVIAPKRMISRNAEIIRDGVNPPTLSEWEQWDDGEAGAILTGRFAEPLQNALNNSSGKIDPKWMKIIFGERKL